MLRTGPLRVLDNRDAPALHDLLQADPVANVFVASRVESVGLDPWRLGAQLWGFSAGTGRLVAACYAGPSLVPIGDDAEALSVFAERARRQGRRCSSLFGPAPAVLALWQKLEQSWGPCREIRPDQPLLALDSAPACRADPYVRPVGRGEVDLLVPASVAMYTEEVGVSPLGPGAAQEAAFRARVAELVAAQRAYARIENGEIVFKAEVGAATAQVCQVQGVWVHPDWRGRGLGAAGTAAVVRLCQATIAPTVSLYVNAFNVPARRAYARTGLHQVGTFASVLF